MDRRVRAEALFAEAIEIVSSQERAAFLDGACQDDLDLRQDVARLVDDYFRAGSFLESPIAQIPAPTLPEQTLERPGTQIGPYKLLQQIGEGGMGTVFMAEQSEPVERRVALKVIKPGMDSRQVIARFEAERQALALMDHPNIAKVLDAGTTETGRPYFVMELVKGIPITQYCDEHRLTLRQRLELFMPVCLAIQHAHQKGIIHRDIKPSNILIAEYDERPIPKAIDFGVAKAIGHKLTERTMFTEFGQLVGTLEYMSPEQAKLNQLDIDTRTDIYSLGVLLYELLTGSTPFDQKRLRSVAFDDMLRIIREEEPEVPSTRLSSSITLPKIAANRHEDCSSLPRLVRGELDWITMKCLEKDRGRRYESPSVLARDIERYLRDEPVLACPPSSAYRILKFVRRHRTRIAVATLVSVMLMIALVGVVGGIGWAMRDRAAVAEEIAREKAEHQERLRNEIERALHEVQQEYERGKLPEALAALRHAEGLLATAVDVETLAERVRQWRSNLDLVASLEKTRSELGTNDGKWDWSATDRAYRNAFQQYGLDVETLDPAEAAARIRALPISTEIVGALDDWVEVRRTIPNSDPDVWRHLVAVAEEADPDPVRSRLRKLWGRNINDIRDEIEQLANSLPGEAMHPSTVLLLARVFKDAGLRSEAEAVLRDGQARYPGEFRINFRLAYHLNGTPKRPAEAEGFYRAALATRPHDAVAHSNLGVTLLERGKAGEAERAYREAIRLAPNYALARLGFGNLLRDQRKWAESIAAYEEAIRLEPSLAMPHAELAKILSNCPDMQFRDPDKAIKVSQIAVKLSPDWTWAWQILGWAHYRAGQWQASIEALERSCELQGNEAVGDSYQWYFIAMSHWRLGNHDEARKWYDKAIAWTDRHGRNNAEELGFMAEAATLIGAPPPPWEALMPARVLAELDQWEDSASRFAVALERMPNDARWNSPRSRTLEELAQWDDVFEKVAQVHPENADVWIGRGRFLASHRRWSEAVEAFTQVIDELPLDSRCVEYACLLLLNEDEPGYRQFCQRLVSGLAANDGPAARQIVARACVLSASPVVALDDLSEWIEEESSDKELHARSNHVRTLAQLQNGHEAATDLSDPDGEANPVDFGAKMLDGLVWTLALHRKGDLERSHRVLVETLNLRDSMGNLDPADRLEGEVLLRQLPDEPAFWRERGNYYARRRQWKDALAAYTHDPGVPWWTYACVLLLNDEVIEYRAFCEQLSKLFPPEFEGEIPFELPAVCALSTASGIEPAQLLAWAEAAVRSDANGFSLHALAAAEYRAGHFDKAIKLLEQALGVHNAHRSNLGPLFALTHYRLGRPAEGRKWLDEVRQAIQAATPRTPDEPIPWAISHWMAVEVWLREIGDVVGKDSGTRPLFENQSETLLSLARDHLRASQWDKAAATYIRALDALPIQLGTVNPRKQLCLEIASSDEVWNRLIATRPDDPQLWIAHGRRQLMRGEWEKAAAAYGKLIDQHPIDDEHFEYACLLAILGERAELETFLSRTAARSEAIIGQLEWYVLARAASIVPQNAVGTLQAVAWGQDAVDREDHPWFRHALALAQYRAGNFEQALVESRLCEAHPWSIGGHAISGVLRAMSHHQLGERSEARQVLQEARKSIDPPPHANAATYFPEWLEARLLIAQAKELFNGRSEVTNEAQFVPNRNE